MKISRSAVVPSGQHLAAVATAFDEDGMPSYVFVGRADLSSSRCNLAVLERGRKGAYQEAGHLARALNDTLAVDALAWHAARDTLYALCYTDDDRSRTGGLQLFAFPHASKRDAPPRQHVASFSGRYHHSLLFEADARRDALVGVVVDESGARAALFAFDCATGAVRRQVVRDVPSDSAALGAVYDAQYSRYVVGISGVMASSLDIYTHEGRVARLPTPKNALKPAAFANGVQRVACMEWIRKSRSFGDTVHVYALERPGAESATTVLCRLRLERSHIRDLVFTPTAEYILALYGEPPVDAVVPLTRAELDQMRGALPASKQSSSSSLLSPPAASASPSKKSASPFKRAVRSVSSSVKKLQRIVTPIPNAALEGTATKGTDALTLELGVHCLIGARNGGAVFAIMERGDVCECRLPQSEGGAPRQLQQDAGEDSIERIDIEALLRRDVAAWLARADSQALLQLVQEQPDAFKRLAKCEQHGGDDDNEQHLCCRLTSLIGSQQ
jgi:hypothetical protein